MVKEKNKYICKVFFFFFLAEVVEASFDVSWQI